MYNDYLPDLTEREELTDNNYKACICGAPIGINDYLCADCLHDIEKGE